MSAEHTGIMIKRIEAGESIVLGQRCSVEVGGMAVSKAHCYLPAFQVNFKAKSC